MFWICKRQMNGSKFNKFFKQNSSVQLLSALRGHLVFSSRHNGLWPPISKDFYARFYPLHFLTILILEKEPVFPFFNVECQTRELLVPFFITSLVWRGPWLGIEPGASRTRRQHSTTRLSRRRWNLTITLIHSSNEKVYIQCDYLWTIKTHDCPWFDNRKKCLI